MMRITTWMYNCMNRPAPRCPERTLDRQSGVAIVELALLLPFMAALFLGFTELGRALYQQNMLTKAMTTGARYVARIPEGVTAGCLPGPAWGAATSQARTLVSYPDGADGGLLLPGLDQSDALQFTIRAESSGGFDMCIIRLEGRVPFITLAGNPLPMLNLNTVGLNAATEERFIGE